MDHYGMGFLTCKYADARYRDGADCPDDRGQAPPRLCAGRIGKRTARLSLMTCAFMLAFMYAPLNAETLRIATMNAALERKGPGLLLRDILRDDPQVIAFAGVVRRVSPDILVLQGIDYDHGLTALKALRDKIDKEGGPHYPHVFANRPNTGMSTGLDMDGDG